MESQQVPFWQTMKPREETDIDETTQSDLKLARVSEIQYQFNEYPFFSNTSFIVGSVPGDRASLN